MDEFLYNDEKSPFVYCMHLYVIYAHTVYSSIFTTSENTFYLQNILQYFTHHNQSIKHKKYNNNKKEKSVLSIEI